MTLLGDMDFFGLQSGIRHCFASVFSELNLTSEAWFQKSKLLTLGRDNYADYIASRVGQFPLFAANRSVSVSDVYVLVSI
jgi:hypothetical protein